MLIDCKSYLYITDLEFRNCTFIISESRSFQIFARDFILQFANGERRLAPSRWAGAAEGHGTGRWSERASLAALALLLVAAPAMFGSEGATALAVLALLTGLCLLCLAGSGPVRPGMAPAARFLVLAFALLCLWGVVQALLPVSGAAQVAEPSAPMGPARLSRSPTATLGSVLQLLTHAGAFLAGLAIAARPHGPDRIARIVAATALAVGLYGFVAWAAEFERILWVEKHAYLGYLTGPFVNRNTAAAYLGLGGLVLMSRAVARAQAEATPTLARGRRAARFVKALAGRAGLAAAAAGFLILCVLLTGSRAGTAALLLGFVALGLAMLRRRLLALFLLLALTLCVLFLILLAEGGIAPMAYERLLREGLDGGNRSAVYGATLRAIADHPLTGTGLGTFHLVFPAYRSAEMTDWGVWDRAHQIYLELALGAGLPMAVLVVAAFAATALACLLIARRGPRPQPAAASAFAASVALAAHGLVDFSLQNPAVATTYAVLLGAGCAPAIRTIPFLIPSRGR